MKALVVGTILSFLGLSQVPVSWEIEAPPPQFSRVEAVVTAYTADASETDDRPWETASGSEVREGIVACPSRLAFGTRVEIAGKLLVCEDRMHRRFREGEYYDVFLASKSDALAFGRQTLEVKVYD